MNNKLSKYSRSEYSIERMRIVRDGDCFCITLDNFVNLQESPAVFIEIASWRGQLMLSWVNGRDAGEAIHPLRHLPAIELLAIWRELVGVA